MLVLGNIDAEQIRDDFLAKLHNQREDAHEYEFGIIKGEQLETWVKHNECGKRFNSRPYLFLQEKWPKRCPHCFPYKKSALTETDIRYRIAKTSSGNMRLISHEERYSGKQKNHFVEIECRNCGNITERNFQNIKTPLVCHVCKYDE